MLKRFLVLFILINCICIVFAQTNYVDYGSSLGLDNGHLLGKDLDLKKETNSIIVMPQEDSSIVVINSRKFLNLKNDYSLKGDVILTSDNKILSFKYSDRVNYNEIKDRSLSVLSYRVHFSNDLSEKQKEKTYLGIEDFLKNISIELKKSLKDVYILSKDEFEKMSGIPLSVGFAVMDNSGKIYLKDDFSQFDVFIHEVSHLYHYRIRESNFTIENDKKTYHDLFTSEWRNVSGLYNKVIVTKEGNYLYKDAIYEYGPRLGYARAYGGKDSYEDVATSMENIKNPEFYIVLFSNDNSWKEKYKEKINLLFKYKFISEKEYKKILDVAGVK